MKYSYFLLIALLLSPTLVVSAELTDNGDGTVTDSRGITWLKYASDGFIGTWEDAVEWADNLVFAGYDDWRLPCAHHFTTGYPDDTWWSIENEWAHLYKEEWGAARPGGPAYYDETLPMEGYTSLYYWTDAESLIEATQAYAFFSSFDGVWNNNVKEKSQTMPAVAVRGPIEAPDIATPILLTCTIEGVDTSVFYNYEDVCIKGSYFKPNTYYKIKVTDSLSEWYNGMPLPIGTETSINYVYSDSNGNITPVRILLRNPDFWTIFWRLWKNYDVIVYLGEDEVYQERYDGLDSDSGTLDAGFRLYKYKLILIAIPLALAFAAGYQYSYYRTKPPPPF